MMSYLPKYDEDRFPREIIRYAVWRRIVPFVAALAMSCGGSEPAAPEEEAAAQPTADAAVGDIVRVDPRVDSLISADAAIEMLAYGFTFIEGPVWDRQNSRLLFSDVRGNEIYQWSETDGARTFIDPVFEGDRTGKRSISSNGLTLDAEGRLIICEHGNRRISRLEEDGSRSVVVETYEGGQLNSPNDAVFASDGSLYFTDPPYGLEGLEESPDRELDFNGIYRLSSDGELELLVRDQTRPNGIALSPDETTLYVANSDAENKVWMAYDIDETGASNARVFYDVNDQTEPGAADGMKVDRAGRGVDHRAGRHTPRHDQDRGGHGQCRVGRRRTDTLPDVEHEPVSH